MRPALLPWLLAVIATPSGLGSCQDDLVQTAKRLRETAPLGGAGTAGTGGTGPPPNRLDCRETPAAQGLPADAAFGEGDVPGAWPLVGGRYGPGEGPGLTVSGRDTFRVYVNGHGVGQSAQPRTPLSEATVHHSRFNRIRSRAPHTDGVTSKAHLFNNVHSNITEWAVGSECRAEVLLEGSVFENVDRVTSLRSCGSVAKLGRTWFNGRERVDRGRNRSRSTEDRHP